MSRYEKLALATVVSTILLVAMGVIVRATGSGMGCPDWPLCNGELIPSQTDYKPWLEWIHRDIAVVIGFLILGLAWLAFRHYRDRRSILWPTLFAVVLVGFQAYLGKETVRLNNSGVSVLAHLAAAMALLGLLTYLLVRIRYPARISGPGASQRFTLLATLAAASTYALLLFGSNVMANDAGAVFTDWPLMNGGINPAGASGLDAIVANLYQVHALHRYVAAVVGIIVLITAATAWRTQRARPGVVRLALWFAGLFLVQVAVGALLVFTVLAPWARTLHVIVGAVVWALGVALAVTSYYEARTAGATVTAGVGAGTSAGGGADPKPKSTTGDTVRAYIALTKPRIIELLLITTIPAMVLATRDLPGMTMPEWLRLAFWTLVCGTLAAGSANAINQYLDRDIDLLMSRTRKRPLPAHQVTPENAMVFGIVLGIISVSLMAWTVNLVAAFLTLLAIAFYVVVYTIMLKRTTPQNIVIGGAAGALPPVIGWAAVTGRVEVPAIVLFLLVFYWTPPHFWALALRIRKDYEAARVPMLPVVKGVPETTRQIAIYTVVLVAISLLFAPVAGMGLVYLVAAVALGSIFLWRSYALYQQGTSPEGSLAQSIRLYKYSISYLTLLFAAVAVDALVLVRL
ncbi:MAG: heme o synthase [Chloroflexota bacterium]